ncbi:5-methylcytosine-specific restriction protein A [Aurantimicrobium minutum]|uniref:HNH endonuclease n=1 Tax=Aurantimicrobium minutum TaxID=708131 RepID=UPI00247404C8|nr:HNH endonuclease [Aurantimicrobium minutum]MDH6277498.1 5-methylcytosine-specific restriction protein A [Aurantimicrobium minutum]
MNVSKKVALSVYERDSYRCAACSSDSLSIQHRTNRGMGGDPKGYKNVLSNLMALCGLCNGALEVDTKFRDTGIRNGWKTFEWDDTERVAVFYIWAREWRLLSNDGTFRVVDVSEITRGKNDAPLVIGKAA